MACFNELQRFSAMTLDLSLSPIQYRYKWLRYELCKYSNCRCSAGYAGRQLDEPGRAATCAISWEAGPDANPSTLQYLRWLIAPTSRVHERGWPSYLSGLRCRPATRSFVHVYPAKAFEAPTVAQRLLSSLQVLKVGG
jgi:hypothetical protein